VRREARVAAFAASERPKHLHPRAAAAITVNDAVVGRLGLLHPNAADALEVSGDVAIVEIDLDALEARGKATRKYSAIPRFPASTRDVALVVSDDVAAGDVERAVRDAAGALATDVRLFDRFSGASLPAN